MTDRQFRIGIVYPWGNIESCPAIRNAIELLSEAGYLVDVFTKLSNAYAEPTLKNDNVTLFTQKPRWERSGIHRFLPYSASVPLLIRGRHNRIPYLCFIGVDPIGLAITNAYTRFIKTNLAYYSLELLLSYELKTDEQFAQKAKEKKLCSKCVFVIIQDAERAALLGEDNKITEDKFVFLPNSPLGSARRQRSDYWHKKFDLDRDTQVVLHAGGTALWTRIEDIVLSVNSWPDGWVLVVHCSDSRGAPNVANFMQEPQYARRVYFSTQPVPDHEYRNLIDGADIGIAFYYPHDVKRATISNLKAIGHSSGKINAYLSSGLPVIMNDTTKFANELDINGCCKIVSTPEEIGSAIREIAANADMFSDNSILFFNGHLRFEAGFAELVSRITTLHR